MLRVKGCLFYSYCYFVLGSGFVIIFILLMGSGFKVYYSLNFVNGFRVCFSLHIVNVFRVRYSAEWNVFLQRYSHYSWD